MYTDDHHVVLMYLNDCDGDTIIFDKKYTDGPTHLSIDEGKSMSIFKRVTPKAGKIILFDGKNYHTNVFPSPGKFRFVLCLHMFLTFPCPIHSMIIDIPNSMRCSVCTSNA